MDYAKIILFALWGFMIGYIIAALPKLIKLEKEIRELEREQLIILARIKRLLEKKN